MDEVPPPDGVEWDRREKLAFEKEILKMYVSDHPLRPYAGSLGIAAEYTLGELVLDAETDTESSDGELDLEQDVILADGAVTSNRRIPQDRQITLAGMIASITPMTTKKGDRMARFMLEDLEGSMEMILFPRPYDNNRDLLVEDAVVQVKGFYESSDRGAQVKVNSIKEIRLTESEERTPKLLELRFKASVYNQVFSDELFRLLEEFSGIDPVVLILERESATPLRAELPVTVDSFNTRFKARLIQLAHSA